METNGALKMKTEPSEQAGLLQDPQLCEALRILDNSQGLIRTIFLGLAMQYHSLDLQRELLLSENPENASPGLQPKEVQTAASLVTLCALFGFLRQAEKLAARAALEGAPLDCTDVNLSATIILISLIRLFRLNRPENIQGTPSQIQGEELEELGEEADPDL